MSNFKTFDDLPAFLSTRDLINLGLYRSLSSACLARLKGKSPDYFKVDRKVLYKKEDVIRFIEKHMSSGSERERR